MNRAILLAQFNLWAIVFTSEEIYMPLFKISEYYQRLEKENISAYSLIIAMD
jgi:hypothetical protein